MGLLRGFGYFIAILILIGGVVLLPLYGMGIPLIIGAIIMMWASHKGGQVTKMQKDMQKLREIEEANARREMEIGRRDALRRRARLEEWR